MTRLFHLFRQLLCTSVLFLIGTTAYGQSIVQLGLIVDASSSTDEELPTFRKGVGDALANLKTDGSLELTLTQFSAEALVIFGPSIIDSSSVLQEAIEAALAIDPTATEVPPFKGGTNLEDAFLETLNALQGSANAAQASLQFVNMLSDGHPTSHNHLGFADIDEFVRHERGQDFAKQQRDALVAAGVDVISFEALGSSAADLDYLKTLAYPEPAVVVEGSTTFPKPITDKGFLLPIATIDGIADALTAKFEAAGFATVLDPDPLFDVHSIGFAPSGSLEISWVGHSGFRYQVEYSADMQLWFQDLPNSVRTTELESDSMRFETMALSSPSRYYRVVKTVSP